MATGVANKPPYTMRFDVGTIKHLGLQMYSTLPPVIGELVADGWGRQCDPSRNLYSGQTVRPQRV